jgi:hypothetical protein
MQLLIKKTGHRFNTLGSSVIESLPKLNTKKNVSSVIYEEGTHSDSHHLSKFHYHLH